MFSVIRTGAVLAGLQRSFSQRTNMGAGLTKTSLISNFASNTLRMHANYSSTKEGSLDKKQPISREEYMQKNLLPFDEFCQKVALPFIKNSGVSSQRMKELSELSNLQEAYKGYCDGHYRAYVNSLDPMNPFIL